jgi:plasmid stabilization system protein ParE
MGTPVQPPTSSADSEDHKKVFTPTQNWGDCEDLSEITEDGLGAVLAATDDVREISKILAEEIADLKDGSSRTERRINRVEKMLEELLKHLGRGDAIPAPVKEGHRRVRRTGVNVYTHDNPCTARPKSAGCGGKTKEVQPKSKGGVEQPPFYVCGACSAAYLAAQKEKKK